MQVCAEMRVAEMEIESKDKLNPVGVTHVWQLLKKEYVAIIFTIRLKNKAGYTATPVTCGWAGAIFEVT